MIRTGVCFSAKAEILAGIHQLGDVYKIALYLEESEIGPETSAYGEGVEIIGQGYEAGGKQLSAPLISIDGEKGAWTFEDIVWTDATISARGAMIYNASKENRAIAVFNFEKDVYSTDGTFTIAMPETGLITAT